MNFTHDLIDIFLNNKQKQFKTNRKFTFPLLHGNTESTVSRVIIIQFMYK